MFLSADADTELDTFISRAKVKFWAVWIRGRREDTGKPSAVLYCTSHLVLWKRGKIIRGHTHSRNRHEMSTAVKLVIPAHLRFADLDLTRSETTGSVTFNWEPIEAICQASNQDIAMLMEGPEENVAGLLVIWYELALSRGEPTNQVQEQIRAYVDAGRVTDPLNVQTGATRVQ